MNHPNNQQNQMLGTEQEYWCHFASSSTVQQGQFCRSERYSTCHHDFEHFPTLVSARARRGSVARWRNASGCGQYSGQIYRPPPSWVLAIDSLALRNMTRDLFQGTADSRQQQSSVLGAWRVWLGAADEMHETDSSALLSCTHKPSHATQLITTEPVNIASKWVNIVSRSRWENIASRWLNIVTEEQLTP